jgi:ureidoacrylate peracid hydrolase
MVRRSSLREDIAMHKINIPQWVVDRVISRRGRRHVFDNLDPRKTALLVVDLQNGFMMDGVAHSLVPTAREIVPNVNRIAASLRDGGGLVVWIQNTSTPESLEDWSVFHNDLSTAEGRSRRLRSMEAGSVGHQLWAELDVQPNDAIVRKERYSAFIQGSSNVEEVLRARGIDTVVVTGTVTGVCCESTARDAMMRNFKTIMVSDGCAARTDEEHNAALTAFYTTFGDVMSTEEVIGYIQRNAEGAALRARAVS